jgi:PAB1-binding protein PBP1
MPPGPQKGKDMKSAKYLAAGILLIFGTAALSAQSLGDYARSTRKTKPPAKASASHHYDNDNLPKNEQLSVVGQSSSTGSSEQAASGQENAAPNADSRAKEAQTSAERKQEAEELQQKVTEQRKKIDALSHELDLTQREYKLRAASFYGDAGARLRNAAQWDKDDAHYKEEIADKQKALDAAHAELEATQEAARKAGVRLKDDK